MATEFSASADAATLVRAYASGAHSPVLHLRTVLDHIAQWEPHIAALWAADADAALAQARASEARWRLGQPLSPLDGVPVTIKENIATQGTPLPLGTAATELQPAAADAPPRPACARPARCCWARPRCRTSACCRRACRAFMR